MKALASVRETFRWVSRAVSRAQRSNGREGNAAAAHRTDEPYDPFKYRESCCCRIPNDRD